VTSKGRSRSDLSSVCVWLAGSDMAVWAARLIAQEESVAWALATSWSGETGFTM